MTNSSIPDKGVEKGIEKAVAGKSYSLDLGDGVKLEMIWVEGGLFNMGAKGYARRVILDGYWIGKYEVTQAQYKVIIGKNPSKYKGLNRPVETVSWDDCHEFISKLNTKTEDLKIRFSLPTDVQWEYAAFGGSKSRGFEYPGSNILRRVGWYKENSGGSVHAVGMKKPNELGLYDMSGNLWEWCEEGFDYSDQNLTKSKLKWYRFLRGGGYNNNSRRCRPAFSDARPQDSRSAACGFRLVASVPEEDKRENAAYAVAGKNYSLKVKEGLDIEMIWVAGGLLEMGSEDVEVDETVHCVELDGYWIGKYEVLQGQYEAIMGTNPSSSKGETLPVDSVSWNDCREFIRKLNHRMKDDGIVFALPTEAQWEYAARNRSKFQMFKYSGSNHLDRVGWYNENSGGKPHSAGQKKSNRLGLYDMSGNVSEWCADGYSRYYFGSTRLNPINAKRELNSCVVRGGSWNSGMYRCHSSWRDHRKFSSGYSDTGLRLAAVAK